jgi:acetoin utilization deacetylase AcuC-like enzyme
VPADAATLCLAHDAQYVQSFLDGTISQQQMRSIGLPWSQQLVQRTLIGTGSAVLAARLALQYGVACMCNGGTHHAHRAHGSGAAAAADVTCNSNSYGITTSCT